MENIDNEIVKIGEAIDKLYVQINELSEINLSSSRNGSSTFTHLKIRYLELMIEIMNRKIDNLQKKKERISR